jgi:hypothetical protein
MNIPIIEKERGCSFSGLGNFVTIKRPNNVKIIPTSFLIIVKKPKEIIVKIMDNPIKPTEKIIRPTPLLEDISL